MSLLIRVDTGAVEQETPHVNIGGLGPTLGTTQRTGWWSWQHDLQTHEALRSLGRKVVWLTQRSIKFVIFILRNLQFWWYLDIVRESYPGVLPCMSWDAARKVSETNIYPCFINIVKLFNLQIIYNCKLISGCWDKKGFIDSTKCINFSKIMTCIVYICVSSIIKIIRYLY